LVVEWAKTKYAWGIIFSLIVKFFSQHGSHLKLESENSNPSSNFKGEEIWLLGIQLVVFG
jgi:hypothetical protein